MLVVAGDPELAEPLAEMIDADLCLGPESGLAYSLPEELRRARSLPKWRVMVLALGVKEVLDRDSSTPADQRAHHEAFGALPPDGPFRLYEKSSFSCLLDEMSVILGEPNPRPFVIVVPVTHFQSGPRSVIPCLNRALAEWCKDEDFLYLPESTFPFSRREDFYDDPVSGSISRLWVETIGETISASLDRLGV